MPYKVVTRLSLRMNSSKYSDHSNESYRAVLPCGVVYYAVQSGCKIESEDELLKCDHSNESY